MIGLTGAACILRQVLLGAVVSLCNIAIHAFPMAAVMWAARTAVAVGDWFGSTRTRRVQQGEWVTKRIINHESFILLAALASLMTALPQALECGREHL